MTDIDALRHLLADAIRAGDRVEQRAIKAEIDRVAGHKAATETTSK